MGCGTGDEIFGQVDCPCSRQTFVPVFIGPFSLPSFLDTTRVQSGKENKSKSSSQTAFAGKPKEQSGG